MRCYAPHCLQRGDDDTGLCSGCRYLIECQTGVDQSLQELLIHEMWEGVSIMDFPGERFWNWLLATGVKDSIPMGWAEELWKPNANGYRYYANYHGGIDWKKVEW